MWPTGHFPGGGGILGHPLLETHPMPEVVVMGEPAEHGHIAANLLTVSGPTVFPPPVEFDGHRFQVAFADPARYLVLLDLAYRARGGDAAAVALLAAFPVTITDADGRVYWPAAPVGGCPVVEARPCS